MLVARLAPIVVLAVLGGWLWHDWQTSQLEEQLAQAQDQADILRRDLGHWVAAAEERYLALQSMTDQYRRAALAVADLEARLQASEAIYQDLKEQAQAAPEADDGPVAPVLRQMIEGLP